ATTTRAAPPPHRRALAEEPARGWLTSPTEPADPRAAAEARLELHALTRDPGNAQGIRSATRGAIGALDRIPWFATAGLAAAGKLNKILAQVVLYLTDPDLHEYSLTQAPRHPTAHTRPVIRPRLPSATH